MARRIVQPVNAGLVAFSICVAWLGGCVAIPVPNPQFPAADGDVSREWARMRRERKPLDRPVVVLAGYRAWDFTASGLASRVRSVTSRDDKDFLSIAYPMKADFDEIVRMVVRLVEARWPSDNPGETTEVDVIGISMGGLVARYAAMPVEREDGAKRLRIRRLYTLGTPHRGAKLAEVIAIDPAARDMRPGSAFIERLNAAFEDADYELTCYARLRDTWVGATRAAPPGQEPIWVRGLFVWSHPTITHDKRILTDIALRLRNETPLANGGSRPPSD